MRIFSRGTKRALWMAVLTVALSIAAATSVTQLLARSPVAQGCGGDCKNGGDCDPFPCYCDKSPSSPTGSCVMDAEIESIPRPAPRPPRPPR